ncbi:MAG TPA: hypothetical protein VGZ26_04300 [Pirellulales bacterium]|nr:hypothetical protein [Pirellulales bacterium]
MHRSQEAFLAFRGQTSTNERLAATNGAENTLATPQVRATESKSRKHR